LTLIFFSIIVRGSLTTSNRGFCFVRFFCLVHLSMRSEYCVLYHSITGNPHCNEFPSFRTIARVPLRHQNASFVLDDSFVLYTSYCGVSTMFCIIVLLATRIVMNFYRYSRARKKLERSQNIILQSSVQNRYSYYHK
jgi:hypothetical protein